MNLTGKMKEHLLSESYSIMIKVKALINPIKIIDKLIASNEERYNIKDAIATSLVEAKIKYQ